MDRAGRVGETVEGPQRRVDWRAVVALGILVFMSGTASADRSCVAPGDPLLQGWVPGGSLAGNEEVDAEFGLAAYEIDGDSTAEGSVRFFDAGSSEVPGPGEPWTLSARLRVVDLDDAPDLSIFLEVTTQFNQRFLLTFGSASNATQVAISEFHYHLYSRYDLQSDSEPNQLSAGRSRQRRDGGAPIREWPSPPLCWSIAHGLQPSERSRARALGLGGMCQRE